MNYHLLSSVNFLLLKEGVFFWLIAAVAFIALIVIIQKYFFFMRWRTYKVDSLAGIFNEITKQDWAAAHKLARLIKGPLGRLSSALLTLPKRSRSDLMAVAKEGVALEKYVFSKHLLVLKTITIIAPLLGLLGSVYGLTSIFSEMHKSAGTDVTTVISKGLYEGYISTVIGLIVAIISYLFYQYFVAYINRAMHDLQRVSIELVEVIEKSKGQKGN